MRATKGLSILLAFSASSSAQIYPITGVKTGIDASGKSLPVRRSINDLEKSGATWDLFIQGLISFQNVPDDDELSYLQISGIHGRPYVAWNGVEQADGALLQGYCTHGEPLFGIWHRPLVAVFEQVLARHVQEAASGYSGADATVYREAADMWRFPYWDWAADQDIPLLFTYDFVTINGPNGPLRLRNPLQSYTFHQFPLNETLFPPDTDLGMASFPETLRCPDSKTKQSNDQKADNNVEAINLTSEVYNFYTRLSTFEEMSTTANSGNSIENLHNEVHMAVGGTHPIGHMAHLGYSGFDPIFMLHHASIDRHVALWQAIYYENAMFNTTYATEMGNFAVAPGANITADSPLYPFYADAEGTFWTGNSAKEVESFGYTYPELVGDFATAQVKSEQIKTLVNQLYGGAAGLVSSKRSSSAVQSVEYFVRAKVQKVGLPLPSTLRVWLGQDVVGRIALLDAPAHGIVHTEIPLRVALQTLGVAFDGDMATTTRYLEEELHWDIIGADENVLAGVATPEISLHVDYVRYPQSPSEFPQYGSSQKLMDILNRQLARRSRIWSGKIA